MTDTFLVEDQYGTYKPVRERDLHPTGPVDFGGKRRTVTNKTASFAVTSADSGKVFTAGAVDLVASLPATVAGLEYTFIVGTASATTGLSISPVAADMIMGNGLTAADDKDVINTAATDRVGDSITLIGDGVAGWYIKDVVGTWARQA